MDLNIEQNNLILEHQSKLPVSIIKLANAFNIDVYRDNKMDKDISGAIINENGIYSIYVNGKEPEHRRRFTIAHEIAHFLLHREIIEEEFNGNLTDNKGNNNIMYRSELYTIFEKEADKLAAEILMPLNKIKELYSDNNYNTSKLVKEFNVSEQAIKIRINNPYNSFLKEEKYAGM